MPIVPADVRKEHYQSAMSGERIPANIQSRLPLMNQLFGDYADYITAKEEATHSILVLHGVPARHYFYYQAFMREGLYRFLTGGNSAIEPVKIKWMLRGLAESILDKIINEVITP